MQDIIFRFKQYETFFRLLEERVKDVCSKYPSDSIHDLKGYAAHYCYIRLKSFFTLYKVIKEEKDFVTAICVLRMLADSVATFKLIYLESDDELRLLRHYLYILDGCSENELLLSQGEEILNDVNFNERVEKAKRNRMHIKEAILNKIANSPLKEIDQNAFLRITEDRNWKFKSFSTNRIDPKQYKWKDLYGMIDNQNNVVSFFSYTSQFVHGLSMSNMDVGKDLEVLSPILGIGTFLQKKLIDYIDNFYNYE